MKKRASLLVLFTTMAFAVAVLVFTPAGQAVADTMRPLLVQVVNDGTSPVPVTGTTSISGTADVNVVNTPDVMAHQAGSWSVDIANQPTVNAHILSGSFVGIDPANNTVQVASSSGTPFQTSLGYAVLTASLHPSSFDIPVDKRFVIEFVSGECVRTDGTSFLPTPQLATTSGGVAAIHSFPMTSLTDSVSPSSRIHHLFAESASIYADPGTTIHFVSTGGAFAPGLLRCSLVVSGQLFDP